VNSIVVLEIDGINPGSRRGVDQIDWMLFVRFGSISGEPPDPAKVEQLHFSGEANPAPFIALAGLRFDYNTADSSWF